MEVVHAVRMSIKFPLFLSPFLIYLLQAYFDLVDLQVRAALRQNKKKVPSTLFYFLGCGGDSYWSRICLWSSYGRISLHGMYMAWSLPDLLPVIYRVNMILKASPNV